MKRTLPPLDASLSWEENIVNELFNPRFRKAYLNEMGKVYIHGAVNALPAMERVVMVKYHKDGLQQDEIAKHLEMSSNEVYILYVRSIRRLRHPYCIKGLRPYIREHYNISRNTSRLVPDSKFHKHELPGRSKRLPLK